jgi:hypothetical protein
MTTTTTTNTGGFAPKMMCSLTSSYITHTYMHTFMYSTFERHMGSLEKFLGLYWKTNKTFCGKMLLSCLTLLQFFYALLTDIFTNNFPEKL